MDRNLKEMFAYLSFGCYEMVDNDGIRLLVKSESCTQSYEVKLRISSNKLMAQNSRQKYRVLVMMIYLIYQV